MMSMRCENLATSSRMWTTNLQHLDKLQSLIALARKNQVSMFPNGFCGFWWKMLLLGPGCIYIYIYVIIHTCKKRSASKVFPSITFSLAKVTLVAMLSTSNAYVGGRSCFRRAQGSRGHRELTLEQGDVVSWLQLKQGLGGQFSASFSTFSASNLMNFFLGRSLRLYSVVVLEVSISLWSCVGMWFVNRSHSCGNPRWREAGSLDYTCYCREEGDPADWDVTGLVVFRICLSFFSSFGKVLSDWHFY